MDKEITNAKSSITSKKKKYPPKNIDKDGHDGIEGLMPYISSALSSDIKNLIISENIVIGEIGLNKPDVRTITLSKNQFVIEFNSGMSDFIHALSHTFAGTGTINEKNGKISSPAVDFNEVILKAVGLFKLWKGSNNFLWKFRKIKYPNFLINRKITNIADQIVVFAQLFILLHEFGHINQKIHGLNFSEHEEIDADIYATKSMHILSILQKYDIVLFFTGAIFATRIFSALKIVGVKFSREYPDPDKRIENICHEFKSLVGSIQTYHEISRMAFAYCDQMDDVERLLKKSKIEINPERHLVRTIACLLEVALAHREKKVLIDLLSDTYSKMTEDSMKSITQTLIKYYVTNLKEKSYFDYNTKKAMGIILLEIIPELPIQMKSLFE